MAPPDDFNASDRNASWKVATARWALYPCRSAARLNGEWAALIRDLPAVGEVRCTTSNAAVTHELVGTFSDIEFYGNMGIVLGPEIDLRLFLEHWQEGAALLEEAPGGVRQVLIFTDGEGQPVLRIEPGPGGDPAAFEALVERYRLKEGEAPAPLRYPVPPFQELRDNEVDLAAFRQAWLALEDTATFAEMLRSFGVNREQGLRLAPEGYARRVGTDSGRLVLETADRQGVEVMALGLSSGCVQIHTGALKPMDGKGEGQLVVEEERFAFRLDQPQIGSAWVVRKPTIDGVITSLELFDLQGTNVSLFFGRREGGEPEDARWRSILSSLT